ncbi:MAG: CocE/NonD family hydrolase [Actinomycetota bacterium]
MGQADERPPDGMLVDWDVAVAMDDGIVLRADVFRPADGGRYPVILSYGPYGKGLAFQEGYPDQWNRMAIEHPDVTAGSSNRYQNWETCDPEKWVPDGYVCVRFDSRGTGCSPGYIDHFSPRETRDIYECIEWAAVQPWSDGKVGLSGISYLAMNQWAVASLQPPHLVAMIPWEGAADWYRDSTHHGGLLSTFWGNWYDMQVLPVQHGYGSRGRVNPNNGELVAGPETLSDEELEANRCRFGDEILAHPLDDAYHRDRSPDWSRVEVPFLSAGNWGGHGLHLRGNVESFVRAASAEKWLELHGLEHWTHYYTDYGVDLQKRFFAYYLKGINNDWEKTPRVLLNVRRLDGFVERAENEWPLARTRWTRFYLDPVAKSLGEAPPASEAALEYEAIGEGLTFLMAPMAAETEITGPLAARLFVSSSTVDADVFVVLRLFDPKGNEVVFQGAVDPNMPVAQGWLRASHRKLDPVLSTEYRPYHTHDEAQPLTPGVVYQLEIEFWPTSIVVPKGYRLGLSVRGKDYEYRGSAGALTTFKNELRGCGPFIHIDPRDRPPEVFGGTNRLHFGPAQQAYLLLPVIPSA